MRPMKSRSRGVTLMELMVALSILSILVVIAVPAFRGITANSRVAAATNDLVTSLTLARSEALRRSTTTRVCASTNQADCSGANNWATGWVVFVDNDNDGVVDGGELIQTFPGVGNDTTLTGTANRVSYNALGMGELAGANVTFTITPSYCRDDRVGQTVVSRVGTVQSSRIACP